MSSGPAHAEPLEQEMKYLLPSNRVAPVRSALEALCEPDPGFPEYTVVSVYFDSPQLDALAEKLDSQLCKTKVRVRWYENGKDGLPVSPAFLEVKRRVMHGRLKSRVELPVEASFLSRLELDDPAFQEIAARLPAQSGVGKAGLFPYLAIRYRRRRYVHPLSGTRLTLDTGIHAARFNRRRLSTARRRAVDGGVLEVKNASGRLPAHLQLVHRLGARWGSFSKYEACFRTTH